LSIIARKLARTVFYMLKRKEPFDPANFFQDGTPNPVVLLEHMRLTRITMRFFTAALTAFFRIPVSMPRLPAFDWTAYR
jgi:hypothetical protein